MYLRPHLTRALSLFRPDLFRSPYTPLCATPCTPVPSPRSAPVLRSSRSHSRCSLSSLSRSHDLSSNRSRPRSRHPAFSHGVPPLRRFALFFPLVPPFFSSSSTPPSRRVIFIICYLLRHTPPAVAAAVAANRRVSGAAHPEKPENRGKQKRPARRAAHPAGWARSNGSGGNGAVGRGIRTWGGR